MEKNGYWMNVLADAQTDHHGIDDFRSRDRNYSEMNFEDIKLLAEEIFVPDSTYSVQIVPVPSG